MPAKGKFTWISENYELVILVAVLVALLVSASVLVIRIGAEKEKLSETKEYITQGGEVADVLDASSYDQLLAEIQSDIPSQKFENRMFVSEKRVACINCEKPIPYHATICPFCSAKQFTEIPPPQDEDSDADGMPDIYEETHGFNENDPDDADADTDGDGFTNLEEYEAGTDPRNDADRPAYTRKLRLARVKRNPFLLRFNSVQELPNDVTNFQLNLNTLKRTYFPQIGDVINDKKNNVVGVKVVEYLPDAEKGPTLIVEKDGQRLRLVKDKPVTEYDLTATMVFLLDRKVYRRQVGEMLSIRGNKFKVVDIARDFVLLKDFETGQETRVSMISEQEKRELRNRSSHRAGGKVPENFGEGEFGRDVQRR